MSEQKLKQGIQFLAEQGLNLYAVFDCQTLPDDVTSLIEEVPLAQYQRLVLLGNGGNRFWPALQRHGLATDHPVDHFSVVTAEKFIRDFLGAPPVLMLYPTGYMIPLQRLGALAGWSHPSPLGLGISADYGVWFAYRVAFLTTLLMPTTAPQMTASPCDTCRDKPCITACPAQAVQGVDAFDIPRCADFRLTAKSACRDRCLSRLACPIAPEHRYPLAQVQYHYRYSLESIRRYQKGS